MLLNVPSFVEIQSDRLEEFRAPHDSGPGSGQIYFIKFEPDQFWTSLFPGRAFIFSEDSGRSIIL